jgi:hypothetical protein
MGKSLGSKYNNENKLVSLISKRFNQTNEKHLNSFLNLQP